MSQYHVTMNRHAIVIVIVMWQPLVMMCKTSADALFS